MIDKSMWGLFYSEIGSGSFSVDEMKKEFSKIPKIKNEIKSYIDEKSNKIVTYNHTIIFLLIQAASFGGKSVDIIENKIIHHGFRNVWISEDGKRCVNPMMPMPDTIIKRVSEIIKYASGVNSFYGDANVFHFEKYINNGDIIFIDPPYMNTQKYVHDFNYINFIEKILSIKKDFQLWITDYDAHSDEYYILNTTNKGGISGNTNKKRTEILSRIK